MNFCNHRNKDSFNTNTITVLNFLKQDCTMIETNIIDLLCLKCSNKRSEK